MSTPKTYVDPWGNNVRVSGESHITEIKQEDGRVTVIVTRGPREVPNVLGRAPAVGSDGVRFGNGVSRFHGTDGEVVYDIGVADPDVQKNWPGYVVRPDGTHGPSVESVRSRKDYQRYLKAARLEEV